MNYSAVLPAFLITLREGVEAALVVGIVLATLKKANQHHLYPWVYAGILVGLGSSLLLGFTLNAGIQVLDAARFLDVSVLYPLLEGIFSLLAIALLSWMLIWMTQQARHLKTEMEAIIGATLRQNRASWGIFSLIGTAVLREGIETVLFITAQFQEGLLPIIGALGGLVTAAGMGVLLFQWGVKINLRVFFQVMGILLLLIVSGLILGALRKFDIATFAYTQLHPQAHLCFQPGHVGEPVSCILGPLVWDTVSLLPDSKFPGILLRTLLGYRDKLYLIQIFSYLLYWLTVGSFYFQSLRSVQAGSGPSSQVTVAPAPDPAHQ